jgi:PAS domain S-box-containing protein
MGNRMMCRMLGIDEEELKNMSAMDIHPQNDLPYVMEQFEKLARGEINLSKDIPIKRKDGSIFYADTNASFIRIGGKKYLFGIFRDITERKQTEERFRSASIYTRSLIEVSLDPLVTISPEGKIKDVNHAMEQVTGITRDKLIGTDFSDYFTEPDKVREGCQEVFLKGFVRDYPFSIRHISGKITDVLCNATVYRNEYGDVEGIFAAARDITQRKKAELEYRTLINTAMDGFYVVDTQGRILDANNSYCSLIGYDRDELLNMNLKDVEAKESEEIIAQHMQRIMKAGCDRFETLHKCKNGEFVLLETSVNYMGVESGKFFVFMRDITEKKRLEKKLRESEEKYRDLFENANDFIYIHDLKGTIISINKIGSQLLGATKEEIIGSNIREWLTPQSIEIFEDRVRKIFLNQPLEQPVVVEGIIRKGEHKWGEATTRLIKDGDRVIGVQGIFRDITERIRLQNELKESEEKYRDLFENAQDAMYVLDNELNFLRVNTTGIEKLGCTKEEIIGTNISRWVTPESLRIIHERLKKHMSGEKINPTDVIEVVGKNEEHRWVEIGTRVIRSDDGKIEIHGIARDITENRFLKQELKKSSKQQKLLCYLIQGTRGGKTRALILKHISDKSYNANELATALNMDYKTIRHHLNVLIKNEIVEKTRDGYPKLYFISNNIDLNLKL